jgi:flagellar basal body-associated protein FliL
MDSSDLEGDIEQSVEKVLDEEEQEQQIGSDQEDRGDFIHEQIPEEGADELEQSEKPEEQEPQPGSDQENRENLTEEEISEERADELKQTEEQELQRGSDQEDLKGFAEEQISEEKAEEPDETEKEKLQRGSEQESLGEFKEEHLIEEEPDVAGEEETESVRREENLRSGERRQKGGRRIVAGFAIGIIVLTGIGVGYLYLKQEKIAVSPSQGRGLGQAVSVSIPHEEVLVLEPFVIPAEGNKNFTYVFLSISMKLPNKEVKREVIEKKRPLRGIIYDTLAREIANAKEVPRLETLKGYVIRGVNGALSNGKISEVFISKFLAV